GRGGARRGRVDRIGGGRAGGRAPERRRHGGAVLGDVRGRIVRAGAAIEARIEAARHAALAREEGVPDAGERGERGGLQRRLLMRGFRRARPPDTPAHVSNPGRTSIFWLDSAIALI